MPELYKDFTTDPAPSSFILTTGTDDVIALISPYSMRGAFNMVAGDFTLLTGAMTDFAVQVKNFSNDTWADYLRASDGAFTSTLDGAQRSWASSDPASAAIDAAVNFDFRTNVRREFRIVASGTAGSTGSIGMITGNI